MAQKNLRTKERACPRCRGGSLAKQMLAWLLRDPRRIRAAGTWPSVARVGEPGPGVVKAAGRARVCRLAALLLPGIGAASITARGEASAMEASEEGKTE